MLRAFGKRARNLIGASRLTAASLPALAVFPRGNARIRPCLLVEISFVIVSASLRFRAVIYLLTILDVLSCSCHISVMPL
jgi:hypothetical protein